MLDPLDAQFLENPYPTYARLREEAPLVRTEIRGRDAALITRYDDCLRALQDPRLKLPTTQGWLPPQLGDGPATRILPKLLALQDPSEPNRLRKLVSCVFDPKAAQSLRPAVAEVVVDALDRVEDKGSMDMVSDFAFPVAILSVAELLGVPAEDCSLLRAWAPEAAMMLEPQHLSADAVGRVHAAADALWVYFEEHVRRRRARQGDDLLSTLAEMRIGDDRMSDEDLVIFCVQHLALGYRTTEALIGNGALALVRYSDQAARLRREPCLAASAVEECLRWDSPFQITTRVAVEDLGIRGFCVPAGQIVMLVLGAANRDPELFDDPDSFEIARPGPPHLSFGVGPRAFIGASLARMQAQLALHQLVRRFPGLRLASEAPIWRPSILLRTLETCPVAFAD